MMKLKLVMAMASAALLMGCSYEKTTLTDIPDAENILVAENGKLFVSGGTNVFEITRSGDSYQKRPMLSENCNSTGLAEFNGWMFAACQRTKWFKSRHYLYTADTNKPLSNLTLLSELDDFSLPNGMAFDAAGHLYISDTKFIGSGSVAKASVSWSNDQPQSVSVNNDWLPAGTPNGLAIDNEQMFLTDFGDVKRYDLVNGRAENETILHTKGSVLDDLTPLCGGVVVADFVNSKVFYVSADGEANEALETNFGSIKGASSVAISDGSVAPKGVLLATSKGVLGDKWTSFGNKLLSIDVSLDLHEQKLSCQ